MKYSQMLKKKLNDYYKGKISYFGRSNEEFRKSSKSNKNYELVKKIGWMRKKNSNEYWMDMQVY